MVLYDLRERCGDGGCLFDFRDLAAIPVAQRIAGILEILRLKKAEVNKWKWTLFKASFMVFRLLWSL